ncbi:VCBS domain-containing protein [Tropicimonas aquimaris]|uniref:VCBS domain-containing protein n=1 Tax=Tropicimonas aquimaris TaxID=914152 RepID=A0ABW3IU63_9RHOB
MYFPRFLSWLRTILDDFGLISDCDGDDDVERDGPIEIHFATTEDDSVVFDYLEPLHSVDDDLSLASIEQPVEGGVVSLIGDNEVKFSPGDDFNYLAHGETTSVVFFGKAGEEDDGEFEDLVDIRFEVSIEGINDDVRVISGDLAGSVVEQPTQLGVIVDAPDLTMALASPLGSSFNSVFDFETNEPGSEDLVTLSSGANDIYNSGNAGGSGIWSETLAFEFLSRVAGAELIATGAEIEYTDPSSKRTDFAVQIGSETLGVAVVRGIGYLSDLTPDQANELLVDKLSDIQESNENVGDLFGRQILVVFAEDMTAETSLTSALASIDPSLIGGTITLIIRTDGADGSIYFGESLASRSTVLSDADDILMDSGVIAFEDVDLSDVHRVETSFLSTTHTTQLGSMIGAVTDAATGDGVGEVTWQYLVANEVVQFLAEGEAITETYEVSLADDNGSTVVSEVEIEIFGIGDGQAGTMDDFLL